MSATLVAQGLSVAVDNTVLLHPTDLTVDAGEWVSIIGPNGAGKSTLLRAIAGAASFRGEVTIDGTSVPSMKRLQRAQLMGWVPQIPTIPPGIRVFDYVLLGRTPHLHPLAAEKHEDLELVRAVLDELDLTHLSARAVHSLSGGERQRAVIGRALAQSTPILLLDEPTTALDLGHQQEVLFLLDRLRREGRTIVTTMHDLTLAGQFADRLVLLAEGDVKAIGSAEEVLTEKNLADHYRASVRVTHENGAVLVVPRIRPQESES
jgi:iron complex transport system ATP-binding protein